MNAEKISLERQRIGTWGALNFLRLKKALIHTGKKILNAGRASGEYVGFLLKKSYDTFPNFMARLLARGYRKLPWRKNRFMTFLAVAERKD